MPAIGAEVADAFIEVHADTGPFRRELRREATLAARAASDDFGTEFTKAIDRDLDPLGAKVAEKLREMGELGGRGLIDEIADQVRSRADRINTAFAQSITFGDFAPFIEQFNDFDDAIEDFDTRLRALNKDGTLTNETFDRLNASFNAFVRTLQDDAISQALARDREEAVRLEAANDRLVASLDRSDESVRRFNIGLGSLKGSRNDFLNFLGSMAGFLEKNIGRGLERVFQGIGNGVSSLGQSLSSVDGPLGAVGKKLDGFGSSINKLGAGGLDGLIIQVAAFVIGLQLLFGILGPLAAGVSGLAAAFTALAVGVGGALLGGILALGPGLAAIAAGAAAVNIAFSKLSKAQKAVFDPLKELFTEIRTSIQERLFGGLGDQVDSLVSALGPIGPFLTQLAGVFRNWVNTIVGEIGPDGPLAATFDSLGRDLPGIFRTLLDLVSAVGGSLTGLFAGAAPAARRLFEGITGVVEQFSAWVNTAAGQQAINEFMQQAVDILTILFGIAKQVGIALGELWSGGAQEAAQTLLTTVQNLVTSFAEWLGDSDNRQALIDFFNNGVRVATAFGTIIGAVIRLFDSLDTQFTRASFLILVGHVVAAIDAFQKFATWTQNILQAIGQFGAKVVAVGNQVGNLGARAAQAGQTFRTTLGNAFTAVGNFIKTLVTRFLSLRNPMELVAASGRRLREQLINAFNDMVRSIAGFVGRARVSLLAFISSVRNVATGVGIAMRSLAGFAIRALSSFVVAIRNGASNAVNSLRSLVSRAVGALSSLPGRFTSLGVSIMRGLYNGIVSAAGSVLSFIRGLASEVAATFAEVLGIFSPSRVFRDLGEFIAEGLALGIEDGTNRVANAVTGLVDTDALANVNAPVSSLAGQAATSGASGGTVGGIAAGAIQIITPFANPRLVALEVMDALAARGK